jgi:cytochrome c553
MSNPKNPENPQDRKSGFDELLDHDYDGIKEYDNPLPGWWVWLFVGCVVWGFAYAGYHWVGPGISATRDYEIEMTEARAAAAARAAQVALNAPAARAPEELLADASVRELGKAVFLKHCAACHLADGGGVVGPNLCDEYFIYGGSLKEITHIIEVGAVEKGMLAWGKTLKPSELEAVAVHVLGLQGSSPATPKAPQGVTADGRAPGDAPGDAPAPAPTADAAPALAAATPPAPSAAQGQALYATCAACHGAQGEGNAALNAPAIAAQEAWYLARQLKNFKAGVRGAHPSDAFGAQMRPMAMTLDDDAAVESVAAYVSALPKPAVSQDAKKDAKKENKKLAEKLAKEGAALYAPCVACHGAQGEGNAALNAPSLASLPAWYIERQLKNFKAGVRGADPADTFGAQMRPMSMMLADDAAIATVAGYIAGLGR